jgi:hypothetical protein
VPAPPALVLAGVEPLVERSCRGVPSKTTSPPLLPLDLPPVGGQTRVSDMNADEGSPHHAGSNTTLPAGIQARGRSPRPVLAG